MCTSITIGNKDNYYMCKSMDFFEKYNYSFVYFPENSIYEEDIFGNNLKSKYKMMGTTFKGFEQFIDGINEKGLMGSTNSFKNEISFKENINLKNLNLTSTKLLNVFLANCKNIEEVIEFSKNIRIFNKSLVNSKNFSRHYHYMISDSFGKTVVLEFENGKLEIFKNKYKIMTNNPKFLKHIKNLENFIKKDDMEKEKFLSKNLISPTGRFIKSYSILNSLKINSFTDSNLIDILNQVSVKKENLKNISNSNDYTITIYQSILDSKNKIYKFKHFNSNFIYEYNFKNFKKENKKISIDL